MQLRMPTAMSLEKGIAVAVPKYRDEFTLQPNAHYYLELERRPSEFNRVKSLFGMKETYTIKTGTVVVTVTDEEGQRLLSHKDVVVEI